jgi:hypothetical protein
VRVRLFNDLTFNLYMRALEMQAESRDVQMQRARACAAYAASCSSGTRVTVPAPLRHVRLTSLPSKDGTKCAILNRHPHSLQRAYHPFTKSGVQ